ncbi:fluoride efflux transporter CrcB [Methylobacterium sp. PvR107]|uniref:fluoride efflux transporter CrcB n=1 Tax=unclassified Methylobacterium TaxID=2615210 RepID=UPI001AE89F1A|nr:fluoride efflux transporter CrcB [Methylobacterium sp. PvR107]MBP1182950.1 CrcB protein [Methylobacterium sp. PvR107]
MNFLIVFLGAGVGGAIRHGINLATSRLLPGVTFPVATLFINVLGSFLMGIIAESFVLRGSGGHPLRLLLTTGVLGGFTTFSTFSLDAITLYERGQTGAAFAYVLASVIAALLGLLAALALVRGLLGMGPT